MALKIMFRYIVSIRINYDNLYQLITISPGCGPGCGSNARTFPQQFGECSEKANLLLYNTFLSWVENSRNARGAFLLVTIQL